MILNWGSKMCPQKFAYKFHQMLKRVCVKNAPTNLSSGKARDRIRREDRLGRKLVTRGLSLCFDLTPFCHIFIMIVKVRSKGVPPLTICHKEDVVTGLWLTRG